MSWIYRVSQKAFALKSWSSLGSLCRMPLLKCTMCCSLHCNLPSNIQEFTLKCILCCPIHCIAMQTLSDLGSFEIAFFETVAHKTCKYRMLWYFNWPLTRYILSLVVHIFLVVVKFVCAFVIYLYLFLYWYLYLYSYLYYSVGRCSDH